MSTEKNKDKQTNTADSAPSGRRPATMATTTAASSHRNSRHLASSCSSLSPGSSIWTTAGPLGGGHHQASRPNHHFRAYFASYQAGTHPKSIYQNSSISSSSKSAVAATSNKFHRAAIEGYVDMLCEASKRDTNLAARDQLQLTPTLLAAQNGQLDALRILVGRGGDPERVSSCGSSALHLAAARNHLNCVSFLVNFGVNMWALDNDLHTAKDVAAMEQQKLVLDYLDQMMAKQSAINTKSVQKLKEKAKLAAEKRLKQMRKAQLKAIKQVERDERLLAKMSSNRRLLKAAHSISDIKLVGRGAGGLLEAPSGDSSSQHSASNKLANYISQRQQADWLSRSRHKLISDLQFDPQPTGERPQQQQHQHQANSDFESSYSSSVSSTSGYLSSSSARSILRAVISGRGQGAKKAPGGEPPAAAKGKGATGGTGSRPKYSDLVKQTSASLLSTDRLDQPSGHDAHNKPPKCSSRWTKRNKRAKSPSDNAANEMTTNAAATATTATSGSADSTVASSSSSSSSRLRGFSGVSRKVHLRRLLFSAQPSAAKEQSAATASAADNKTTREGDQRAAPSSTATTTSQPSAEAPSGGVGGGGGVGDGAISWPPAPSLTRALSEPDFSQAAWRARRRVFGMYDEDDDDEDDESNYENNHRDNECDSDNEQQVGPPQQTSTRSPPSPPSPPPPPPPVPVPVPVPDDRTAGRQDRVHEQKQLLTKCLSQLKLQHEAINREQPGGVAAAGGEHPLLDPSASRQELLKPSRLIALTRQQQQQQQHQFDRSDELIRHQLEAGQFPVRPSIIKQQQQQQQHLHSNSNSNSTNADSKAKTKTGRSVSNKSTTIVSVDSIGSANSFAQRNCPASSSSPSCSDSSTRSSGSRSSHSSSSAGFTIKPPPTGPGACSSRAVGDRFAMDDHDSNNNETDDNLSKFLASNGLAQLTQVLQRECIDLEALLLLSEDDLKSLDILLGPRKKLLNAIEKQRAQLMGASRPGPIAGDEQTKQQQQQMFVVVDTQF